MNEKNIEGLEKVGLTKAEAKTYLALIELKESKTGSLCKAASIPSSNMYHVLESLMEKGLVSYRLQNNIKVFMPALPEVIDSLFIEKQKRIEEERKEMKSLIKSLKDKEQEEKSHSKYKYYEGIVGVKSMWHEINESLHHLPKSIMTKYYTGVKEAYEPLIAFYDEFHKTRMKLGISNQAIFPFEDKKTSKLRKKQNSEVKFMELKNEAEWGVIGDLYFIQYITAKTPRGFLIHDDKFAKTFEQVFDQLWKQAKE
jgi:HTH-type transcriptional regulator, sugar sensing transcriptional regulator